MWGDRSTAALVVAIGLAGLGTSVALVGSDTGAGSPGPVIVEPAAEEEATPVTTSVSAPAPETTVSITAPPATTAAPPAVDQRPVTTSTTVDDVPTTDPTFGVAGPTGTTINDGLRGENSGRGGSGGDSG
jgi:hypothetical protein